MGALSWLRIARRVPGLGSQPELPNLETLVEAEALLPQGGYHLARWIVPLGSTVLGLSVFLPLALTEHLLFLIGAIGMPVIGGILGLIFHWVARQSSPQRIRLRKQCNKVMTRLNGLRNLLGHGNVISANVGSVLEEAAKLYLSSVGPTRPGLSGPDASAWGNPVEKARSAMDDAMATLLTLAEPESVAAQDAELARGWAIPLLDEMRATAEALRRHRMGPTSGTLDDGQMAPLSGLREARAELQRIDSALDELHQEAGS